MPVQKRHSKKIHDKKKSNPKRSIRQSKKGGTKTSIDQVNQVIKDMNNFLQGILKSINDNYTKKSDIFITLESYSGLTRLDHLGENGDKHKNEVCEYMNKPENIKAINNLIKEIGKIVGGHVTGIRRVGVQECSSFKNLNRYFQCEEKKIDQYKEIGELCDVYSSIYRVCGNPTSFTIKSYESIFIALENNAKKLQERHEMKLNNQGQKYKDYKAQANFNKEKENYVEIIGNELWPIIEQYKMKNVVFFHEKNNKMVELGIIEDYSEDKVVTGYGSFTNYYIKFKNSKTNELEEIFVGGISSDYLEKKFLYYEKDTYKAAAIQPGGKRRSRKKRNMKKSKKGKSKNRC